MVAVRRGGVPLHKKIWGSQFANRGWWENNGRDFNHEYLDKGFRRRPDSHQRNGAGNRTWAYDRDLYPSSAASLCTIRPDS